MLNEKVVFRGITNLDIQTGPGSDPFSNLPDPSFKIRIRIRPKDPDTARIHTLPIYTSAALTVNTECGLDIESRYNIIDLIVMKYHILVVPKGRQDG